MSWSCTSNAYLRSLLEKEAYLMMNIDLGNSSDGSWYFYGGKYADVQYTWERLVVFLSLELKMMWWTFCITR